MVSPTLVGLVLGGIRAPKVVHILIPEMCGSVTFRSEGEFTDVVRIRVLNADGQIFLRFLGVLTVIARVLTRGRQEGERETI